MPMQPATAAPYQHAAAGVDHRAQNVDLLRVTIKHTSSQKRMEYSVKSGFRSGYEHQCRHLKNRK
jgi:hypothetical protein